MNSQDFADRVRQDNALLDTMRSAAAELAPSLELRSPELTLVAIGTLYPIFSYIVRRIGFPWANAVAQLSDLQLARFHEWLDRAYETHGLDRGRVHAAAESLYRELAKIEAPQVKEALDRLANEIRETKDVE